MQVENLDCPNGNQDMHNSNPKLLLTPSLIHSVLQTKNVGYFDDEIEAAQAYDQAVLRMRGLGADLNFPEHVEIQHAVKHSDTEPEEFPVGESAIVECAVKSILQAWNSGMCL